MTRLKFGLVLTGLILLGGCAATQQPTAPLDVVARAAYTPEGPTTVTLLTAINNRSGQGAHSALLIDGQQRVMFDPAGSWHHPQVPERGDVLYGMTPAHFDFFMDYHARETYHMVVQEVEVSPAVAAALIQAVEQNGPVNMAQCALAISTVLQGTPGFEGVSRTWYPKRIMAAFDQMPGVQTSRVYDDDSDDNLELLQAQGRRAVVQERLTQRR